MTAPEEPPVVAVVGATASGKTGLSLDLAERLGGEIINTDAMQVYRGMDIGTAKLPLSERRGIPHHLLDVLDVSEAASVAEFQARSRSLIAELRARGAAPVLVGGSALYTRAILDRFEFPDTDPVVRRRLEAELEEHGSWVLHQRLAELDPQSAQVILASNGRRVVRALEAIELTGEPWSATLPTQEYAFDGVHQIGVAIDREDLDARITQRVDTMFANGFVAEVEALVADGLMDGVTASRAIGYSQVAAYLRGELSEAEARLRTAAATRRFARRQDGWFHKDPRITWVRWDDPDRVDQALKVLSNQDQGNRDQG